MAHRGNFRHAGRTIQAKVSIFCRRLCPSAGFCRLLRLLNPQKSQIWVRNWFHGAPAARALAERGSHRHEMRAEMCLQGLGGVGRAHSHTWGGGGGYFVSRVYMCVHALLLFSLVHLCVFFGLDCPRVCSIFTELTRSKKFEVESR